MFFGTEKIRLTGRWSTLKNGNTVTTACGSMAEIGFCGSSAVIECNTDYMKEPYPHLWICVDDSAYVEASVSRFIRINAKKDGKHTVKVVLKSSVEMQHRWFEPLEAKLEIIGFNADDYYELPGDSRKLIEFVGDSITEGILIDENNRVLSTETFIDDQINRVHQDDSMAAYGYRTAELLNCRAAVFAYGGVGITKGGSGGVPRAEKIYKYCINNMENNGYTPDLIVTNYGANDWNMEPQIYISGYEKVLKIIRETHPDTQIVVLSPFKGFFREELADFVTAFNKKYNDNVYYINSYGWVPKDPVHPIRENHGVIAGRLAPILDKFLK